MLNKTLCSVLIQLEVLDYSCSRLKALESGVKVDSRWAIAGAIILSLAEIHKLLQVAKAMEQEWYYVWAMCTEPK